MNILIFLVILIVLVLVHEFGHFIVAKKSGIRVDEFGLGFPPRIFGKKFGGTIYSINALPFGGFVKIFGENPADVAEGDLDRARSMVDKPKWIQAAVLAAGVSFNIIFAWIVISLGLAFGFPTVVDSVNDQNVSNVHVVVSSVLEKSPAGAAGLKTGDIIVGLQDSTGTLSESLTPDLVRTFITESKGPIDISYKRGTIVSDANITPTQGLVPGKLAIGISMDLLGIIRLPIPQAFGEGAIRTVDLFKTVAVSIFNFAHDAFFGHADLTQVAGPVGMVGLVGDARDLGIPYLIFFAALLSINLAVINLIPFPALDGGRLFILFLEAIKGSPLPPKLVNAVNAVGFALLILLMLLVTFHDIAKFF